MIPIGQEGHYTSLLLEDSCGQIISDLSPLDYLWIMTALCVCLLPPTLWKIISPQTTQVRAKFVKIDRKFYTDSIWSLYSRADSAWANTALLGSAS